MPRWVVPGGIALLAAGIGIAAFLRRPGVPDPGSGTTTRPAAGPAAPAPPPSAAKKVPATAGKTAAPSTHGAASTPPAALPAELRSWREAVLSNDAERLDHARHRLDLVDDRYRPQVMRLAAGDRDPRVRTATIDYLANRPKPPGEEFFIERLDADGHDGPREVAARTLERLGTAKALEVLDKVMENEATPKAVRSRAARAALHIRRRLKQETRE